MSSLLANLKPELLWKHFDEIRNIPHCSRNEGPLSDYVMGVARKNGVPAKRDDAGNVIIEVPATPGHENAPVVVLQGHLDMVCEKNSDVQHDFDKDPINVRIDGEWITADGTTLGADNAIGMAAALAVLEDDTVVHGPLELLFTTDEETGLNGARSLTSDALKGRILLNMDSEEEGAFFIGCAGGADTDISLPVNRKNAGSGTVYEIKLFGLRGGHSGIDIHTGRGNAVQLLARMLYKSDADFELISLEGGSKHNAIPREAFAKVSVQDADGLKKVLQKRFDEIQFEYKAVETSIQWAMDKSDSDFQPMETDSMNTFLSLLLGLPHGVEAMSLEIEGLVETSNNLAIVKTEGEKVSVYTSTRSSIMSALKSTRTKIEAIAKLAGAEVKQLEGYPAWTPNLNSELLKTMKKVYKDMSGRDPEVLAIHAGLECGIIGDKFDGMDMISFGPDLKNPHSPDEKVHIGSVQRFWELVVAALKAFSK